MSYVSSIEWTDATWNPIRGCSRVSEGCKNCYAERMAARFSGEGMPYDGLAKMTPDGPRWTGKLSLVEGKLGEPLRWKNPRRIFVNSMSDLFHERVSDQWLERIFKVMHIAHQHTYQILTKRPKRMFDWMTRYWDNGKNKCAIDNLWLGVSVEDQKTADERIQFLLQTPAAVRWISAEPLLGPLILGDYLHFTGRERETRTAKLDWVVVGGESGPRARPFDITWAYSIIDQCKHAVVPIFMKQLGLRPRDARLWDEFILLKNKKGGDMSEWPSDLRVREFPEAK